jgi:hypothetical protein
VERRMTKEAMDVVVARIDERLEANINLTKELLKIVKGDNGHGLVTRMTLMEEHPKTCPVQTSVRWLIWAVRAIVVIPVVIMISYYVEKVFTGM